ncbi:MAG: hypothetical protein COA79_08575 [Planctomycetota bacterium]|nr:MAG: hypothetical protein COA79_08575 [Planctomycetota bacterium]
MRSLRLLLILNFACVCVVFSGDGKSPPAIGAGVKVVSEKNADSSSVENIIKDIIKPGMSSQQKAEAIFKYGIEHFYHSHAIEEANADMLKNRKYFSENTKMVDTIKQANVYAHGLCGSQSKYQNELFNAAGLLGRVNGVNGHTTTEVKYGGKWHYLDADMMGFVRDRKGKIPSIDDIKANKKLLFDKHKFRPKVYFKFDGANGMWKCLSSGVRHSMYGRKVGIHSMNLVLKDGEKFHRYFQRQWAPNYRYYCPPGKSTYANRMRKNKDGPSRDKTYFHFKEKGKARFGNWELIYEPDLQKASFVDGLFSQKNISKNKTAPFVGGDKKESSEFILNYYSPYGCAGTAGDLADNKDDKNGYIIEGEFNDDSGEIAYSFDLGKSWVSVHAGGKTFKYDLTKDFVVKYGWLLRFTFKGKKAGLNSFKSYLSGQLSPASLPFVDGSTKMTFSRENLACMLLQPDVGEGLEKFKALAHKVEGMDKWNESISGHVGGNGSVIYKIDAPGEIVRVKAGAKFGGRKGTYQVSFSVDDGKTWILAAKQKSLYNEKHQEDFWGQSIEGVLDLPGQKAYSPGCIKVKPNIWETKIAEKVSTKSVLVKFTQQGGKLCKIYGIYTHYKKEGNLPIAITHKWTGGDHTEKIGASELTKEYTVAGGKKSTNLSISFIAGE